MKKLVVTRRLSQIFFLSLFIYILWSTTHTAVFFKIDPLVSVFTISSIIMFILTLILGRFFCGWICPLGSIIDMCGINAKNRDLNLRQIKYYILGFVIVMAFLGVQIAWIFDPLVITARFISLNFIPFATSMLDKAFIFIIRSSNYYAPLYDFYRSLKSSILGVRIFYFSHSLITLAFLVIICSLVVITKRLWCRFLCPLGAIYAVISRFSLLSRHVDKCTHCLRCKGGCRTGAILEDMSYRKGECILCMDCIYDCPTHGTGFAWSAKRGVSKNKKGAISRRDFIFLIASSFFLLGFKNKKGSEAGKLIRPPGVLNESEFLNRCIRCGNCMKVCPTNGLQPAIFESGLSGIWTPHLVPEIGYCEYNCNRCGNACPTGAIPRLGLVEKKNQRLGLAYIDKGICIAWAQNKECIVCEEHCPVPGKAIKTYREGRILKPYVDSSLCIGCGICQNKCPTRSERAIKVQP